MTKIINGSKYSTETARRVAGWENRSDQSDAAYCSEGLHRTKSGKYFLHCEGGPMSRYAQNRGNESSWGEEIRPMTEDQAKQWTESHADGETYELIFGAISDGDDLVPTTFQLVPAAREKLDTLKKKTGLNLSSLVSAAIIAYMEE